MGKEQEIGYGTLWLHSILFSVKGRPIPLHVVVARKKPTLHEIGYRTLFRRKRLDIARCRIPQPQANPSNFQRRKKIDDEK